MKTERFTLTLGVTPGYTHLQDAPSNPEEDLAAVLKFALTAVPVIAEKTGVTLSLIGRHVLVAYRMVDPAPRDVIEFAIQLSGERNPLHPTVPQEDKGKYRDAWILLAQLLKKHYNQVTVRLTEESVGLLYFTGDDILA